MNSLWNRRAVAALMLLGGLAACDEPSPLPPPDNGGGGSTPLAIDSTFPAADVVTAPYGLPVLAYTDSAVQPSTATTTSFSIVTDPGGLDVSRRISVPGGNKLQAVASLLPGTKYRATISPALQSTNGGALPAPYSWSFTTRPIAHFPLATGLGFFGHLALAKDSTGGLHAVYADSVNGDLIYAECASNCAIATSWSTLGVDTVGNIGSSSAIGVDGSGRVHMVYRSDRLQTLQYATCASACTTLSSWAFATADNSSSLIGINPSIAVTFDGQVYATYYDGIGTWLRFARCLELCTLDASWANGTPDTGPFVGRSSSLVLDGGIRHVVYQDSGGRNLRYATCVAIDCVQVGDWAITQVSLADGGQEPALALGPNHLLAATYYASTTDSIKYASCASECRLPTNWTTINLSATGIVGHGSGLTIDANGRAQAVFIDDGFDRLRYATCSSICTTAGRWRYSTIQGNIAVARSPVIVPGRDGGVEILYLALDGTEVRFAE